MQQGFYAEKDSDKSNLKKWNSNANSMTNVLLRNVKHMVVHTGEKKFKCLQCNKDFMEKDNLVKYMVVHTGKEHSSALVEQKVSANREFDGKYESK